MIISTSSLLLLFAKLELDGFDILPKATENDTSKQEMVYYCDTKAFHVAQYCQTQDTLKTMCFIYKKNSPILL